MHTFFCPAKNIADQRIQISDKRDIHHIRNVLRLKEKEKIRLCDEGGRVYLAVIEEISPEAVSAIIEKTDDKRQEKKMRVTIACAMPKKTKMDDIIDRLTQLAVNKIIPMSTERTLVKLDALRASAKVERWRRIALSAAEQSQRNTLPVIEPITPLEKVLHNARDYDLKLIPHLSGKRKTLRAVVAASRPKNVLVLIGPEGDFTPGEVEMSLKRGFVPVTLGDLVLRVETAAVAVASFLRFYEDH